MIIDITSIGRGIVSKTKINYRPSKLVPIEKELKIFIQLKTLNGNKTMTYLDSEYYQDLFVPKWNEHEQFVETSFQHRFQDNLFYYDYSKAEYEDTLLEEYTFVFTKDYFNYMNIVKYKESIKKIITLITGI